MVFYHTLVGQIIHTAQKDKYFLHLMLRRIRVLPAQASYVFELILDTRREVRLVR
jgi:hypothetical protein